MSSYLNNEEKFNNEKANKKILKYLDFHLQQYFVKKFKFPFTLLLCSFFVIDFILIYFFNFSILNSILVIWLELLTIFLVVLGILYTINSIKNTYLSYFVTYRLDNQFQFNELMADLRNLMKPYLEIKKTDSKDGMTPDELKDLYDNS